MKRALIIVFALSIVAGEALAFDSFGHQTIAILADKYMTDKAKSEVKTILKSSMSKESTWLNTLRENPEMEHTKDWHFFTLNAAGKCVTTTENDGIVQLERAIAVLRNRTNNSEEELQTALRTVIHLVGDMHCLSHIHIEGVEATKGFVFQVSNEAEGKSHKSWSTGWYSLWESVYLSLYTIFSPQYYANDIDIYARSKRAEYEKGTPRFWVENGGEDVVRALAHFNTGELVPNQTIHRHEYNHTKCMAKAGYRLAALLNDIFR